jgi:hypothetical protein
VNPGALWDAVVLALPDGTRWGILFHVDQRAHTSVSIHVHHPDSAVVVRRIHFEGAGALERATAAVVAGAWETLVPMVWTGGRE